MPTEADMTLILIGLEELAAKFTRQGNGGQAERVSDLLDRIYQVQETEKSFFAAGFPLE